MSKLLIVEDEDHLRSGLEEYFRDEGFSVLAADSGEAALSLALSDRPELLILDVMLPGIDGFEVCRELRRRGMRMPIIFLTAREEEVNCVVGLEIGGDDYVVKPCRTRELLARVKSCLRRASLQEAGTIRSGELEIDFMHCRVLRNGRLVRLTSKEFDLIRYLALRHGETVSRPELLRAVWGYQTADLTRTVDTHVRNLRRKLEPEPAKPVHIVSVHGEGYRFV